MYLTDPDHSGYSEPDDKNPRDSEPIPPAYTKSEDPAVSQSPDRPEESVPIRQETPSRRRGFLGNLVSFLQDEQVREAGKMIGAGLLQIGGPLAYNKMFGRFERPDYAVTPGLRCYERVADRLPRERFTFPSDGIDCAGYFYPAKPHKGLVAFAHGLHTGADDYLSIFEFLVKNGYSVIAFDCKGTYDSKGNSTVGLSEALVELDHLLDFVRKTPVLQDMPVFVLGHSCGGFAASAVLSLHPEIRAAVTMSAMKDANTMIVDKGFLYSSILGVPETQMTAAFLSETQKRLFGSYTELNGVRAVNESSCPVLIAHGIKDMVVDYWSDLALISHREEMRSENVFYYTGRGACGSHDTIWRSPDAVQYQEDVKNDLENWKKQLGRSFTREDEMALMSKVNHDRYSAINEELFTQALILYDHA